jgi:nucleotide-binding universal stress UspA family protein
MHPRVSSGNASQATASEVFDRVLVGIDSTEESLVAAAQAGTLRAPDGRIVLLAAVERYLAAHAGLLAARAEDELAAGTSTELERARELVDAEDTILASGNLVRLLCSECERRRATLIAVGVRPHGRLGALTFGGHDVEALHDVSCSVLIARPGWGPARPDAVVVGIDGTEESRAAEAVARSLAQRLGCPVVPAIGLEEDIDLAVLRAERDDALLHPGSLLDAIVGASTKRSLVVVGRASRPGRGRTFAERVVHAARCSVLVVEHGAGGGSNAAEPGSAEHATSTDG